jgi:hypothetical protein
MSLPRFTLRQLILSVLWISIGFAALALSIREPHQVDPNGSFRIVERVLGWTMVCIGVIPLVTTRRPIRVLMLALCGVIPGGIIGSVVRDVVAPIDRRLSPYEQEQLRSKSLIPWVGMAVGSAVFPAINLYLRRSRDELVDDRDQKA